MNVLKAINSYGKVFEIGDIVEIYNADSDRSSYNGMIMKITNKTICDGGCRAWSIHNKNKCTKVSPKYAYYAHPIEGTWKIGIHSCYCEMRRIK